MRVSLNLIKKYTDLPKDLTNKQIAYDLTMRTVEVESIEDTKDKFKNIIVGKILEVKDHFNANTLKICMVDIGEKEPVQIVCGGSNLYVGELVVISKPGAMVYWHGEGDLVEIKETKMRGALSYGMICGATEVYLEGLFPPKDESEIVDLSGIDCKPGDNIADVLKLSDTILEIDNKSLTNRPDLWGHYGIARELSTIYKTELRKLDEFKLDKNLKKYDVEIKEGEKCPRYTATVIDNVSIKPSPIWMQNILVSCGLRPINAIVDITNYVMIVVGQPMHAFDKSHVTDNKIIVRNANKGEELLLLDDNSIELTPDDLVICDTKEVMGLAGIKGGKKDSVLDDTTSVVLEVANFTASTIRKTGKRFDEKTDASIRYEKNLDTQRIDDGLNLALNLFKEIYPECEITAFSDICINETKNEKISVSKEFLDTRLGKELDNELVIDTLTRLGYEVKFNNNVYDVIVPTYRSTGDVSIKDDVMGDIARLIGYEYFEAKPLPAFFTHAVSQNKVTLERKLREYLAFRCGFNEIFTYPWIDEKYIKAAKIDVSKSIYLESPPSPELSILRSSLVPGMLEAISKNLRYYNNFKMFEMTEVYEVGEYHESTVEETLPIHKKYLTGAIVGKDPKDIFFELKGIIENMSSYNHMEEFTLVKEEKPSWADINTYLNIKVNNEIIGSMGLVSVFSMKEAGIKRTNACIFEIDFNKCIPFSSRTNEFKHLPLFPLVEKDLSLLVDENLEWSSIDNAIGLMVKSLEFIEEYRGEKIPEGKKSITIRVKIGSDKGTMTTEQINSKMGGIIKVLDKKCNAILREE